MRSNVHTLLGIIMKPSVSHCSLQYAAYWSIRPGNKWQIKRADPEMYPFDTSCLSQSFYFCCIIMRIAEAVAQLITRLLSLQWTFLESSRNSSQTNFQMGNSSNCGQTSTKWVSMCNLFVYTHIHYQYLHSEQFFAENWLNKDKAKSNSCEAYVLSVYLVLSDPFCLWLFLDFRC